FRDYDRFRDSHPADHVVDAAGHLDAWSADLRADVGNDGGSRDFVLGFADHLGLLHLEILQPASRREDQELPRWGQGYGVGSLPPGWDGSSGVGSVRSQGLG